MVTRIGPTLTMRLPKLALVLSCVGATVSCSKGALEGSPEWLPGRALVGLESEPPRAAQWRVGWVRTIDTTADREFLVAVMIRRGVDRALYGLASGASPVEAAARATLHACNRVVGWPLPS